MTEAEKETVRVLLDWRDDALRTCSHLGMHLHELGAYLELRVITDPRTQSSLLTSKERIAMQDDTAVKLAAYEMLKIRLNCISAACEQMAKSFGTQEGKETTDYGRGLHRGAATMAKSVGEMLRGAL